MASVTSYSTWIFRKQCVQSFNVFDFLREIVSKVPDYGGGTDAAGEERPIARRRFGSQLLGF